MYQIRRFRLCWRLFVNVLHVLPKINENPMRMNRLGFFTSSSSSYFFVSIVLSRGLSFDSDELCRSRRRALNECLRFISGVRRRHIRQVNMETTRIGIVQFCHFQFSTSVQGDVFNRLKVVRRCKHFLIESSRISFSKKKTTSSFTISIVINKQ